MRETLSLTGADELRGGYPACSAELPRRNVAMSQHVSLCGVI